MPQEAKIPIRRIEAVPKTEIVPAETGNVLENKSLESVQEPTQKTERQDLLKPQAGVFEAALREKDPRIKFLEEELSKGLEEDWLKLSPDIQEEFKLRGERTAIEIDKLLSQEKVEPEEIYEKIMDWLKISGWSEDFISQEAKLITDKLLKHGRPISQ